MHKDISFLWEHNAFACHYNIMNNISIWYFAVSMLPFTLLRRDRPLLLMALQNSTLTDDFTVV